MLSTSASTAVTAGKWGATAKTVAMGAAGTVLWGSLAFYFVVGASEVDSFATTEAERLFFRMELPEKELLAGCAENFGAGTCDGQAWIILSQHRPRPETPDMPRDLRESVPLPLWEEVAARNAMAEGACGRALSVDMPRWIAGQPKSDGMTVAVLPEALSSCQTATAGVDPKREHQNFWFFEGEKVVAELRCSLPGTYMEPSCELAAFPQNGVYEVSYSRLPATNIDQIVDQVPEMLGVLKDNLPSETASVVDVAFIKGPFASDSVTRAALTDLRTVSQ